MWGKRAIMHRIRTEFGSRDDRETTIDVRMHLTTQSIRGQDQHSVGYEGQVPGGRTNQSEAKIYRIRGTPAPPRCMMARNPARDAGPNSAADRPGAAAVAKQGDSITSLKGFITTHGER